MSSMQDNFNETCLFILKYIFLNVFNSFKIIDKINFLYPKLKFNKIK